jgi:DNA recombination protein RmuC
METTLGLYLIGSLVIIVTAVVVWLVRGSERRGPDPAIALLQQQIEALRAQVASSLTESLGQVNEQLARSTALMNERLRENADALARANQTLGERLDNAARVVGGVQKQLGTLDEATRRVFDIGKDIASLHDILRSPKLRGGLGELLLGDLLAQVLPPEHFTLQHVFRSGERCDAVVRIGDACVPIDAKFPLEDLRRALAADSDAERVKARKAFVTRVKKHVDAIAEKYILPDEGTYDFALMYIPAENVYYETIIKSSEGEDDGLQGYALAKRVIPVSPGSFYAYLQAILLGLKGMRVEQRAREILGHLDRLAGDLDRFREDFRLIGRHLTNATSAYGNAEKRVEQLTDRVAAFETEDAQEPLPLPAASERRR